jgi:predicted DNA-binding ribbon-helix-helix protein
MEVPYHPPVKRSIEIAGHKTSISLEPLFWGMLKERALSEGVPVNALVARIDADRLEANHPPGLAGAIRVWLVVQSSPTRSISAPAPDNFSSSRS